MEVKAKLKTYRQSPRKVRLVAREISGRSLEEAKTNLAFVNKRVAPAILKLIRSAEANAKDRKIDTKDLYIKSIQVGEGPTLFRMMSRAFGRAFVIRKKTSHIDIVLASKGVSEDRETEKIEAKGSGKKDPSDGLTDEKKDTAKDKINNKKKAVSAK